jgi:tetratricopeptide (TPR) repeat protein
MKAKLVLFSACLLPSLALSQVSAQDSFAENNEHLQRLNNTKVCQRCDFKNAGMVFANLVGVNLNGSNLSDANLSRANLSGSSLKQANLSRVSLLGADLTGADLSGANLSGADLNGANFNGANLSGVNFKGADLRRANFGNANMEGAKFDDAYLRDAIGLPETAVKAEDYYSWGIEEVKKGNHKSAIAHFNQTLLSDPKFPDGYLSRAMSRLKLGDQPGAIEDSETAAKLFTAEGDLPKAKASKDLIQSIKDANKEPDFFTSLTNNIAPFLLQFLMR